MMKGVEETLRTSATLSHPKFTELTELTENMTRKGKASGEHFTDCKRF